MSPRRSAPTFPPSDESGVERPSHADSSHIARRRASSAPAHEVDLDEVELFDDSPAAPPLASEARPASQPPLQPPPLQTRSSRPPFQVPLTLGAVHRRSPLATALACALLAAAAGSVAGLLVHPHARRETETKAPTYPPIAPPATPPPTAAVAPSANEVPVVEVTQLPRAHAGVVIGAAGHRLWIDGTLAASWQASVTCGPHVVQVGSAGAPRTVDVPCGESVSVSP